MGHDALHYSAITTNLIVLGKIRVGPVASGGWTRDE
jgi:hypothetical protein